MEVVGIEAVAGVDMDCRSRCMYTMVRFSNMGVFSAIVVLVVLR